METMQVDLIESNQEVVRNFKRNEENCNWTLNFSLAEFKWNFQMEYIKKYVHLI